MKIAVAGTGKVELSIASLPIKNSDVRIIDVLAEKVDLIKQKKSSIQHDYIEKSLVVKERNLTSTLYGASTHEDSNPLIIIYSSNYRQHKNFFGPNDNESVIELELCVNPEAEMGINFNVTAGYTHSLYVKYALQLRNEPKPKCKKSKLLLSKRLLFESKALYENLYPSLIIAGYPKFINVNEKTFLEENTTIQSICNSKAEEYAKTFAQLLQQGTIKADTHIMRLKEAEAVKLFANTYLALLLVSYFNELNTHTEVKGVNGLAIIEGVDIDPRIGIHYHNTYFDYGGYCEPKDMETIINNRDYSCLDDVIEKVFSQDIFKRD